MIIYYPYLDVLKIKYDTRFNKSNAHTYFSMTNINKLT